MSIKKNNLLASLVILHIAIITLSNVLVSIPIEIYSFKITWAAFSFPLIVVATDLTIRLIGKSMAQKTITFSFPLAIISSILIAFEWQGGFKNPPKNFQKPITNRSKKTSKI